VEFVVPLAAATDLAGVVRAGWDSGEVSEWLGAGPDDHPALYRETDLYRRLPTATRRVLIHGTADTAVGIEQSRAFAAGPPGWATTPGWSSSRASGTWSSSIRGTGPSMRCTASSTTGAAVLLADARSAPGPCGRRRSRSARR
jgi:hypothetical protein